ncbi:helix-turn-helix domain-containing protein [Aquimarina megaterium]|uniref:helix-turn-helix domain-containing protein n=1 Tax=Aquimarina megaterium TaxID=1443666 RepID=UPI0009450BAB|nr:AraC family transcriptional regulator [Aquimarina megaterium]
MEQLKSGQHFGTNRKKIHLKGIILNEAVCDPNMDVPWHYHENAYFYYLLEGQLKEVNKKKSIDCSRGTLLFHNWQDAHYNASFKENTRFFHVELERNWFEKHHLKSNYIEGSIQYNSPSLKSIFNNIYTESLIKDNVTHISVEGLLLNAFSEILRNPDNKKTTPPWVERVKEIIHTEDTENISLTWLANEVNIHPVYLSKQFSKYFHTNLGEYLRNVKIERAITLLNIGSLSNAQIAYKCGFSDESHFIRIFKRKYNITPKVYQKLIQGS